MKLLSPLILAFCFSTAFGQTTKPNDKNIDNCFKRSSKTPAAFDLCVKYEFDRIREEKKLAELRANDPPGTVYPCDYSKTTVKNLQKCFDSLMVKLSQAPERTSSTSSYSTSDYLPTWRDFPRYRYSSYYPSRWYPSYLYPRAYPSYRYYPRRYYPSRTYRRYY